MRKEQGVYNVGMAANITRREWAAALAAAVPALAQAQPAETQTAAALIVEARGEIRGDIQQLERFPLPPAAEPAFVFKP
ncbi:MAG TPA: hypothetical protein VLH09_01750 [Bryobacteraceae bacterium]|nr:hypothetical protein [Bryobacteraceae bacterium]